MRVAPARVQFGPQRAPRDGAHRCRCAGHLRLPLIHRWASGLVPGTRMRVAQPIPMLPEAAIGHQARLQRPVTHHLWISGRRPRVPVRATSLSPPAQMGRAEPGVAARPHTPGHRARGRPENRIATAGTSTSTRNSGRTAAPKRSTRPDLIGAASASTLTATRPGRSATPRPPTRGARPRPSDARTRRWSWRSTRDPSRCCTTSTGTPRRNNSVAYEWRKVCGPNMIPVRSRNRQTRS